MCFWRFQCIKITNNKTWSLSVHFLFSFRVWNVGCLIASLRQYAKQIKIRHKMILAMKNYYEFLANDKINKTQISFMPSTFNASKWMRGYHLVHSSSMMLSFIKIYWQLVKNNEIFCRYGLHECFPLMCTSQTPSILSRQTKLSFDFPSLRRRMVFPFSIYFVTVTIITANDTVRVQFQKIFHGYQNHIFPPSTRTTAWALLFCHWFKSNYHQMWLRLQIKY